MQDYYNLVDVYLDAVLQPRCVTDPQTFAQEGWHYELDDAKVSVYSSCYDRIFRQHLHSPNQVWGSTSEWVNDSLAQAMRNVPAAEQW